MRLRLTLALGLVAAWLVIACGSGTAPHYSVAGTWIIHPQSESLATLGLFLQGTGSQVEGQWDRDWPFIGNGGISGDPMCGTNAGGKLELATLTDSNLLFRGTFRDATTVEGVVKIYGRSSLATMVKQSDSLPLPILFPPC
jgi:hypothetical protein